MDPRASHLLMPLIPNAMKTLTHKPPKPMAATRQYTPIRAAMIQPQLNRPLTAFSTLSLVLVFMPFPGLCASLSYSTRKGVMKGSACRIGAPEPPQDPTGSIHLRLHLISNIADSFRTALNNLWRPGPLDDVLIPSPLFLEVWTNTVESDWSSLQLPHFGQTGRTLRARTSRLLREPLTA